MSYRDLIAAFLADNCWAHHNQEGCICFMQYVVLATAVVLSLAIVAVVAFVAYLVVRSVPNRIVGALVALGGLVSVVPTLIYAIASLR